MAYNTAAQVSSSDRITLSILALGVMFVAGYTVARVALTQPGSHDPAAQVNVVPHEGALWSAGLSDL